MPKEYENKIIKHPLIKKIIKYLNLNENQIKSGMNIFSTIIEEQNKLDELDFITKVQVYDENNIIGISAPNGKFKQKILRKKYHLFDQLSWLNPNLKFDKKRRTSINNLDDNLFFWDLEEAEENDRAPVAQWFKDFFTHEIYKDSDTKKVKGFYLCGNFGIGKTTFLNAFANYLIDNRKTIIYTKLSDLNNFFKSKFDNKEELNILIDKIKNVDYLLIDDIGSEKLSEWFLFNILYHILDYRLIRNKMCCFTSNLDYLGLEKQYCKKKDIDVLKIKRLINRIESLTIKISLYGENIKKII